MKKILFPTDFSESANNALAFAGKFARDNQAELVLYHANHLLEPQLLETAEEKLLVVEKEVRATYDIVCTSLLEPGSTSLSSLIGAEAADYDLVIMGTNGADDLVQFFGGSNTFNTIVNLSVPLLVIPVEYSAVRLTNVVYAFDYYKEQRLPVNQLLPWLKAMNKDAVTVLQVLEDRNTPVMDLLRFQQELKQDQQPVTLKFDVIYSTAVARSINQYMVRTDSTILCLCTQKRSFLEGLFHKSVIKQITAFASYPLYVFHQ